MPTMRHSVTQLYTESIMFSSQILVAVVFFSTLSSVMVRAQCPCWPYDDDINVIVCDNSTLTSIPDCVLDNITQISIRTPSIPLVPETIRRFTNLDRLNLQYFDYPQVTKTFLAGHKNLSFFEIYITSLEYIDNDWFLYTPNIKTLVLSHSSFRSLSSETFSSVPLLESISLNSNKLTTLPPTLFQGTNLKQLFIDDNPWQCDCDLATFMQWTRDTGVTVSDKAFCLYPSDLEGVNVKDITVDLACRK